MSELITLQEAVAYRAPGVGVNGATAETKGHTTVDAKPDGIQPETKGGAITVVDLVKGPKTKQKEPTFHELITKAMATPGAEGVAARVDANAATGLRPVRTRASLPIRAANPRR